MKLEPNILESQNEEEFVELLQIFKNLSPAAVIEIGSLYGWSLKHWMFNSIDGAEILSIDYPVRDFCGPADPRAVVQDRIKKEEWPQWSRDSRTKLYYIEGRSQDARVVEKAIGMFPSGVDFLFIDGDHSFEGVKQDYLLYSQLVKQGGVIALHDIAENEPGGVHNFWTQLKELTPHYKEIKHDPKKEKGIGVIFV